MKIIDRHWADCLAVECFYVLYFSANSPTFKDRFFNKLITKQSLFRKLLASFLEDEHTCIFLPNSKIFFSCIQPKIVNSVQVRKHLLFFQKLFELHKLNLAMKILRQSSFGNDHILMGISFIKRNYLPIISVAPSVHIAKLLWHLPVDPVWSYIYFKISMKSWGVRNGFYYVIGSTFFYSVWWESSIREYIFDLTFDRAPGDRDDSRAALVMVGFESCF